MREATLSDGGGYVPPATPSKTDSAATADASTALRKLQSGETLTAAERAILNLGPAVSGNTTQNGQNPPKGNTPTGAPGKAWIWNGTQWVQPAKPTGEYTWDNDKGWVAAAPTFSQTQVDAQIAAAIAKFKEDQRQANQANVTTALEDFRANLKLAGLDSLVDTIDGYIKQDMTAAQIKINLVSTPAYKERFPAMEALAKAGRAVNEATYISMERGYRQVLSAYGLDENVFGTRAKLGTYISNEVSPAEFENRVQIAADRVNKNADVLAALNTYYGVDKAGAISYLLDPTLGMDVVKKQTRAAEIGAAAQAAGFSEFANKNFGVAESFINASGTQDLQSLKTEFGKARILANTQERLASIENGKYADLEAVTAVLGQDQQKLLESQRRAQREQARFAGGTGVSTQSLRTNINGI